MAVQIGVIGGSGLYNMAELTDREERTLTTPFGEPSGPYLLGTLRGKRVAFLARHGAGHRLLPSELNYRANIFGFKLLGVERIISASAVGSLKQEYPPLDIVVPDQFFDRTTMRASTFFGNGLAAHVSFAHPICPELARVGADAVQAAGANVHRGGTYVCMEGPQFSTRAESNMYRSWGMDVIGMTNLQEAKLAREAEICYVTLALVTDYDCWHPDHDSVTVEMIVQTLMQNAADRAAGRRRSHHQAPCGAVVRVRLGAEVCAHHAAGRGSGGRQTGPRAHHRKISRMNPILAVGSVAFDSIKTPFGEVSRVVGGAATYFAIAASFFTEVRIVAVVGDDFGANVEKVFGGRRIDLDGPREGAGRNVPLEGGVRLRPQQPRDDLHASECVRALQAENPGWPPVVAVRVPGQHPPGAAAGRARSG